MPKGVRKTEVDKLWKKLSRWLRTIYTSCAICQTKDTDTVQGFLHGHHIGNRNHEGNQEFVLCPFNILVVCQECHAKIEKTSYQKMSLVHVDANRVETP